MATSTFSLSWEAHRNNICNGLGILQQNEEFVDMTLAADGHFVKVHQVIMALASPYFKELISSAEGKHPVIFLNKISNSILTAILEYIYTGEVSISIENLSELLQAGRELHIKGLKDMKLQDSMNQQFQNDEIQTENDNEIEDDVYFEITKETSPNQEVKYKTTILDDRLSEETRSIDTNEVEDHYEEVSFQEDDSLSRTISEADYNIEITEHAGKRIPTSIQYTVSNQGSLQMILNRYIYYLKHSNRNNSRQWRCVDYLSKLKCPAVVMTMNNVVKQRFSAHIHSHHDKRILKKVNANAIFSHIRDAENQGNIIKDKMKNDKGSNNDSSTNVVLSQ